MTFDRIPKPAKLTPRTAIVTPLYVRWGFPHIYLYPKDLDDVDDATLEDWANGTL